MHHMTSISDRKIRFALVGCGRIAQNHFAAMETHADRCELVDVCDINPTALQAAVAKTGARGHAKLADLLANTTADCVILTTPSGLHPNEAIEVAQALQRAEKVPLRRLCTQQCAVPYALEGWMRRQLEQSAAVLLAVEHQTQVKMQWQIAEDAMQSLAARINEAGQGRVAWLEHW